mgnify:CR=1 FL=1
MDNYDDFFAGLEGAIDHGFVDVGGESHFDTEKAADAVIDFLEEQGVLMFLNDN